MVNQSFAVPTIAGKLCAHFGHCESFAIVAVENSKIISESFVAPPAHHPGSYPNFLAELGVNTIITGGMGPKAQDIFTENNIEVYLGVQLKEPKKLVQDYLDTNLIHGENQCDH
jgi:predicted Fe-Mo cluster-binding NifX family protein